MLPNKTYIKSVIHDERMMSDMITKIDNHGGTSKSKQWGISAETIRSAVINKDLNTISSRPYTEAIILEYGRPALLVQSDDFVVAESDEWNNRLRPTKSLIRRVLKSVGRIELIGHPDFPWVGTGWQITDDIIVTNRHVALEFGVRKGKGFIFKLNPEGLPIQAQIDYREEYRQSNSPLEFKIEKILFISDLKNNAPDVAFLKLEKSSRLPDPLPLKIKGITKSDFIGVVGYPAKDGRRNDETVMEKIFGDIYNVKRLQPGQITHYPSGNSDFVFYHDCSTLGGNSGSVVFDINTGEAVGLHFGGRFKQNNYAVKSNTLLNLLSKTKISVSLAKLPPKYNEVTELVSNIGKRNQEELGYNPKHLGTNFLIPLPGLKYYEQKNDLVVVNNKVQGVSKYELKYTHFSIAMSKSRRMPIFSICNIDGNEGYKIPRKGDKWYFDDRIEKKYQIGNELYKGNDLDRGHMTRREDPVWGATRKIAKIANEDTFHYINACPQHKDLNQNKSTWQGLENYILDNARSYNLKVTVITGPVFADKDMLYRGVLIPNEFWKVVVIAGSKTKLSVTAYLLSQKNLLGGLDEIAGFKYSQYKTFQVSVKHIEQLTNLSFGKLSKADPLNTTDEGINLIEVRDYENIKF